MISHIAAQELRYLLFSLQGLTTFLLFLLLGMISVILVADDSAGVFLGAGGQLPVNSSYMMTASYIGLSIFSAFVAPSFIANALLRDSEYRFDALVYATPVHKRDYLVGRWLGAYLAMALALTSAPLGMLLGRLFLSSSPELTLPLSLLAYIPGFVGFMLSNLLIVSAVIFAVAALSRSTFYPYLAVLVMLLLYIVLPRNVESMTSFLRDPLLVDAFTEQTRYWTVGQLQNDLVGFVPLWWLNRLFWAFAGFTVCVVAYRRFSFTTRVGSSSHRQRELLELPTHRMYASEGGQTKPSGIDNMLHLLLLRMRFEILGLLCSRAFLVLLVASGSLLVMAFTSRSGEYGIVLRPVTYLLIGEYSQNMLLPLLLGGIVFSGELMWRERKCRIHEIVGATATPDWVFVTSKLVVLAVFLCIPLLLAMLIGLLVQVVDGYWNLQAGLYLERGLLQFTLPLFFIVILSTFMQVVIRHRYLGMVLMLLWLVASLLFIVMGMENPLLRFGLGGIDAPYSEMNGSRGLISGMYWQRIYWAGYALLLATLTVALWNRGVSQPLRFRVKMRKPFRSAGFIVPSCLALTLVFGAGGYIYFNTHVLNDYRTVSLEEQRQADFERKFGIYAELPMPRISAVQIEVDLYPRQRRVETRGTHQLVNRGEEPIAEIHVDFPDVVVQHAEIEGAELASVDEDYGYYIFTLNAPMLPGEARELRFTTLLQARGFAHNRPLVGLVENGIFLDNTQLTPYLGVDRNQLIADEEVRGKLGLGGRTIWPDLDDEKERNNNRRRQDSDFISFEAVVSTSAEQTAITSGTLIEEWSIDDRHFFHYRTDAPIINTYPLISARYEVQRGVLNGIELAVFHHAPHSANAARLMEGMKESVAVFDELFGAFQFRQLRLVEIPAYHDYARSMPGTIVFAPNIGFITEAPGDDGIDLPYYVVAHEVAHQWWGQRMMAANTQGAALLSETFAQYSALLMTEKKYGQEQIRRFLKAELDNYLSNRGSGEVELPIYRVEGQQAIYYRKGAVIMYALKDYLGEDVLNRSLRRLMELRAWSAQPYASPGDFLGILKEEAGPGNSTMIEDFLERITLFDLKVTGAHAETIGAGSHKVRLEIEAMKFYADGTGQEREAQFDLPVDLGFFLQSPDSPDFSVDDVLLLEKVDLSEGASSLEFELTQKPVYVGIDPYNKLIDRNSNDNLRRVE